MFHPTTTHKANDNMNSKEKDEADEYADFVEQRWDKLLSFLPFDSRANVMLFFDGANTQMAAKALSFEIDYKKLRDGFAERCNVLRSYYFQATPPDGYENYAYVKPLTDFLSYNNYHLITKPFRQFKDADGVVRGKGNMDIEIAIQMMKSMNKADYLFLFSGDGDFKPLLEECQLNGHAQIVVVSTLHSEPPVVSDELRKQADHYIDWANLEPVVKLNPRNNEATHRRMKYSKQIMPRFNDTDEPKSAS